MDNWSQAELALLWRHNNEEVAALTGRSIKEVAALTGRSIKEVGDKRLQVNLVRNGWDKKDPAAVTKWEAA